MKRRILSLLIVLCVAISLLAVSAFAAVPSITVTMNGLEWKNVEQGTSLYAITTSSTDANGYLTGTATECLETDNWNIHLDYTGEVPVLYLQNATLSNVETINEDETITLGNALTVTTNGAFVLNSVEGTTNTLYNKSDENGWSTSEVPLALNAKLGTTITGTGKLIGEARTYVRYTGPIISTSYELTFKDADVDLVSRQYDYGAINTGANVTFDGGNVKLSSGNGTVLIKRSSANSVVTVKNGANVQLTGNGNSPVITNTGDVIVENSTLEYTNINSGWASGELPVFPKTSGTHLVEYKLTSDKNTVRSFLSTDEADADYIAGGTNMSATDTGMDAIDKGVYYLKITHVHTTAGGCTEGGACLDCGAAVAPKANHAFDNDCTTADKCANCAVVAEANAAHVFDDNCTTADKCANCEAVASAVAAHSFTNKASDQLAKAATTTTLAAYYVQCDNCEVVSDTKTVKAGQYAITVEMLGLTWTDIAEGTHKYATTDAETQTATECTESDNWNIHLDYTTGKTPTLYLKGATLKAAVNAEANGIAALKVTTNGAFVLNSAAGTTNTLTNDVQASYNSYAMNFLAKGGTTITGSGLLVGNTTQGGNSAAPMRTCYDLTLKDANVELSTAAAYQPCIAVAGGWDHESQIPGLVVIDGGNVKLTNMANGRGIAYLQNGWGQSVSNNSTLTTKTVTIKNNANVQIIGSGNANPIGAAGGVIVENATLEIDMTANGGQTGWISAELPKFPTINGTHQVEYIVANNLNVTKSFLSTDTADADYIAAGTDMTAVDSYLQYLKISHVHNVEGGCTAGGTCVDCGAEVEAKAHSYADDGDCTTAVNCSVCGKVVIPATEHVAQEGTYICTDAIPCVNCDKNFREAGNHTPNADDGDCTSAITCSVCDAVTTPAESAHKYTDLDDTTCDNAGCIATRLAGLHATISGVNMDTVYGETKYATMGANGAVALVGVDDAWNIKIDFTDDVPVLSLQNITATGGSFNLSGKGALQIDVLTDVTITGNNVFTLAMEGGTTISSPTNGLLTVNMSSTSGTKLLTVPVGALTFKNANVAFSAVRSSKYTAGEYAAVDVAGDVVFSGGTATITGSGSNMALKVGGDLTVEKGANVTLLSDGYGSAADVTGDIKVNNATLIGRHSWGTPNATKWLFNKMPTEMVGVNAVYSTSQWNYDKPNYQKALAADATSEFLTNYDTTAGDVIYYIAFTHTCVENDDCSKEIICGCGNVIPAAEHTPGEAVEENRVASTCTVAGSYDEVVYCSVCDAELSRETKALDLAAHTEAEAVEENRVESTCTVAGSYDEVVYCSVCDAELSRETKALELAAHNAEGVVEHKDATCTETGVVGGIYCSVCNDGKAAAEEVIPALDHDFSVLVETVDPTVDAEGYTVYKCSRCDETKTVTAGELTKPTLALNGTSITVNDPSNVLVQTGVKYVGVNSGIDATTIVKWTDFTGLTGTALDGKNGYTNNGKATSIQLADNGDYIFYVIYKNGDTSAFYAEKITVVAATGDPTVTVTGNTAALDINGNTLVQFGVKYVGDATVNAADLKTWSAFTGLTGKALDGKNGYTNLGKGTVATLADNGNYIFYVIYKDALDNTKTIYINATVAVANDKPAIEVVDGVATLKANGFTIVQSGVKYVGDADVNAADIKGWGTFTGLTGTALNGKNGYTNLGKATEANLTEAGNYVYYVIYKDANSVTKTTYYNVTVE
ncbi:MAG: hypothetical protein E7421_01030 [Ruminococcaceae bacterium]|nr:hypothetical protein [Oscillospiraceae bacterium]